MVHQKETSVSAPIKVLLTMLGITWLLATAHVFVHFTEVLPNSELKAMFNMAEEQNVPTWFSSLFWLAVGVSAFGCFSADKKRFRWLWLIIGAIFSFASLDEFAEIHERVGTILQEGVPGGPIRQLSDASPDSPWIGFYLPVLIVIILCTILFVFSRLHGVRRRSVFLGGFCFYALAIAMDFYQGMPGTSPTSNLTDASILLEEVSELVGSSLLTYVLTSFWVENTLTQPEKLSDNQ